MNDDSLKGLIREKFRDGLGRVYGRTIWRFLLEKFRGGHTQECLAASAGTDQGSISTDASTGTLTMGKLVALAVSLNFEMKVLPLKPPLENLADGGFACCMSHLQMKKKARDTLELTVVDFELLRNFRREREWDEARGPGGNEKRRSAVQKIRARLSKEAKDRLDKLGSNAVTTIQKLESEWSDAWDECVGIVKDIYKWTKILSTHCVSTRSGRR